MQIISWICQGVKTLSLILKVIAIYLYRGQWQIREHQIASGKGENIRT